MGAEAMAGRRELNDGETLLLVLSWEAASAAEREDLGPLHCYLGWTQHELTAWRMRYPQSTTRRMVETGRDPLAALRLINECKKSRDGAHYIDPDTSACRFCTTPM